jgi:hypothetical protein
LQIAKRMPEDATEAKSTFPWWWETSMPWIHCGMRAFGSWSYQVVDTKLAKETRGGTMLQLALYSEMLGVAQNALAWEEGDARRREPPLPAHPAPARLPAGARLGLLSARAAVSRPTIALKGGAMLSFARQFGDPGDPQRVTRRPRCSEKRSP